MIIQGYLKTRLVKIRQKKAVISSIKFTHLRLINKNNVPIPFGKSIASLNIIVVKIKIIM